MGQLYSSAKVLWFPDRLAALRRGEPVVPRTAHLPPYRRGGEAARSRRDQGATPTNGSRLRGKVADAFAECPTWVRVSIDGWDGESDARYRDVKRSEFDKVLGNLEAFARRDTDCLLGASLIVDRDNAARIHGLCRRLKACDVRHAKITPGIVRNDGRESNVYHAAIAPEVRDQIAAAAELADEGFEIVDHYHGLAERFDKPYHWCPFLHYPTVIGADCTVYTGQDKAYTRGRVLRRLDPGTECRHHCVAEAKNRLLMDYLSIDPAHAAFA